MADTEAAHFDLDEHEPGPAGPGDTVTPAEARAVPTAEIDVSEQEAETLKAHAPKIEKFFRAVVKMQASDLHLKANCQARVRLAGKLRSIAGAPLANEKIEQMLFEIMNAEQKESYHRNGSADFAYQLGGSDRFRINIFRQRGLTSVAARRVNNQILNFDQLHLPQSMYRLADFHQGLVLIAGVTGSGKSTTLAATLDRINATRSCHIVTLEDPIEYLFTDKKSFINQREIGLDVKDFHDALRYLMREDPDVVLIGEMRDVETFSAALHAAETGHLVFGTVHASGAAQVVTRLLDLMPESSRDLIRQTLVFNLQAVVVQKLLPSIKPGLSRVPCVEVMFSNPMVRKLISEKREEDLVDVIKGCGQEGMLDFNESIHRLINEEYITMAVGEAASPNPEELRMRLKGIRGARGGLLG